MIRHIVMWKLTDEAKNNNLQGLVADLKSKFKALMGLVEGLLEIELGLTYDSASEYSLVLCCKFESKEALDGYQIHPAHLAIKDCIKKNTSARIAADYEI